MTTIPVVEPVGIDPAVQEAMSVLTRAMAAAATRHGHTLQTFCVVWATHKAGNTFGGSMIKGDVSPDVMEMLAELALDAGEGETVPDPLGRQH